MQQKKIYSIIVLLLVSTTIDAQFKKGMRMAGASIGNAFYNSGKSDYSYPPPTAGYTSNNNSLPLHLLHLWAGLYQIILL